MTTTSVSHVFSGPRTAFSLDATATGIKVIGKSTDVVVPYGDVMVFDDMSRTAKNTIDMIHHVTSHIEGYTAWETQADLPVNFLRSSAYWDSTTSVFPDRAGKVVVSYIIASEFTVVGGWDWSFDKSWDKNGDDKIDADVKNLPDYVDISAYNEDWHNYRAKYWTAAWRDQIAKKIDHVASQGFDGVMMDVMTGWVGWLAKMPNDEIWLKEQMAELFRWISDYAKEKYGSSFVVNANLDADAASYFPDMGKYIDGGYFQNAFWNWNGNGENYPDGAGSRGEPFDFLLQQGIQPLYMDHIGTGPRDLFPWLEDFDAKATTAKYLETFGHAIDRAALPYIAPLLFGKPYAMAPRYARVDSAGLHAGTVYRDWVIGSAGNDKISGGDGADLLAGLAGNDRLDGGSGIDTAYYARSGAGVAVSLGAGTASGEGRDTLVLIENVIGSNFVDVIRGSTGKNRLEGGDGDDRLYGLAGSDTLLGGAGNDRLFGGDGQDILTGGAGKDIFIFDSVPAFRDTISDFSKAAGEKIQLSKSVFTAFTYTGTPKSDDFHAAAGATAAEDASDRIVYNKTSGILYYDADGVGGVAPVEIAMIGVKTHADLAASDFMIIA